MDLINPFKRWALVVVAMGALVLVAGGEVNAGDGPEASAVEMPDIQEHPERIPEIADYSSLVESIEAVLSDSEMRRTTVGIHVEDLNSDEILFSHNADQLLNPASNVKLLTAAAVLDKLGPSHTFSTELSTKKVENGRIEDLYIRGEGEAFLLFRDVLSWAGELRMQGVEAIDGDLVIDDGIFDGAYLPPAYDIRESDAAWRAPIGAVSVNFNAVSVKVEAAEQIGQAASVRLDPPNDHVQVVNRARTTRGSVPRISISGESAGDGTRIVVSGTIGVDSGEVVQRKRIDNPPAFAGAVVAEAMQMMGIEFSGQVRRGEVPEEREKLFVHRSAPVMDALSAMNKWSNNFIADQLLRVLGSFEEEPSTWDGSRLRMKAALDRKGLTQGSYALINGSGLYDGNELSARQLVTLLRSMRDHPYGPEFVSTLAIAGVDGTMRSRLNNGVTRANLRAKTGTLRDVTALSGYVTTAGGREVAFSIIFNDPPRRAWNYRDEQDRIARAIASFEH
jgi:serine-type D-Ala-D-Ala carboxypeptidase/endopeptidase (penicillin-binding protein 4)